MNLELTIEAMVKQALAEDIASGDITAELIADSAKAVAQIKTREAAVVCGTAWVNEVYRQLQPDIIIGWQVQEGERVVADQCLCELRGSSRALLTGERSALNFLQTLSGTATVTAHYVQALQNSGTQLLDTRKTIPGWRLAQKYAVTQGGGKNHRLGLYDAFLIKENHISACGSISATVKVARAKYPDKKIEVEVENLQQLQEALEAKVDMIMLDNFNLAQIREAVVINAKQTKLEVSGNVDLKDLQALAQTGVDYISVGALTKHVKAIDLSMRFVEKNVI